MSSRVSDEAHRGIVSSTHTCLAGIDSSAGTYTWDVPTSLQSFATYGFTIIQDTNTTCFQYSFPFHITGLSGGSSSGGSNYVASTSTVSNSTTSYPTSKPTSKPTSNITLSTTLASQTIASQTIASNTQASSTGSASPTATKNAAVAQVATGSLAMIGGLVLALAL
jgi:Ser-Thr-rich glycosyl-phosphatidyl-inositol-anchored membrane family